MRPLVVTTFMWGELGRIEASTVLHLADKLSTLCPFWTYETCFNMAARLSYGDVLTVQDAEAVFIPGAHAVLEVPVFQREGWSPAEVQL